MAAMEANVRDAIAAVAADRTSGATALVCQAIEILRGVATDRQALEAAAREVCRAQPAMAGMRTAAALALAGADPARVLEDFGRRVARAPATIARVAAPLLTLGKGSAPLRVVTCSRSAAVHATLLALAPATELMVACSESRPGLEGRTLAECLADAGIHVELYTDAGVGTALQGADALLVGSDALGPDAFINKVGTGALCALAAMLGVPAYVLAGREKILPGPVFDTLDTAESVTDEPPVARVHPRNPFFERVSLASVAQVITDGGAVHPASLIEVGCWRPEAVRK
jgi:translation initiation factor 2B subunit (eIF-2B alpha/beta/delta family)